MDSNRALIMLGLQPDATDLRFYSIWLFKIRFDGRGQRLLSPLKPFSSP